MEKKKVSLSTFLIIVGIIVIGVLACYLVVLTQKEANAKAQVAGLEKSVQEMQQQLQTMQTEKNNLQEKVDAVTNVVGGNKITESNNNNVKDFSESDLIMDNAKLGYSLEELTKAIGNYEDKSEYVEEITGEKVTEVKYDSGNTIVLIRNGKVVSIKSSSDNRTFARGIKLGISKDEVKKLFPTNSNISSETISNDSIVYADKTGDEYKYSNYIKINLEKDKVISVYISTGDMD